jgi:hypothetical protein
MQQEITNDPLVQKGKISEDDIILDSNDEKLSSMEKR